MRPTVARLATLVTCLASLACGAPAAERPAGGDSAVDARPAASSGQVDDATARQEVAQLERDWAAAMSRADSAALGRMLAEEVQSVGPAGQVVTRRELLDAVGKRAADLKAAGGTVTEAVDTVTVRRFGDVAVATGQYTSTYTAAGKQESGRSTFADVAVRRDGRWQFVLMTSTEVPAKRP